MISFKNLRLACVGTYPPRRCGIATFSFDLCEAISHELASPDGCQVVAINDVPEGRGYDGRVRFEILEEDISDYTRAADFLNIRCVDVMLVQHEFGIFGGEEGEHLLTLMAASRMPIITTLHTVRSEEHTSELQSHSFISYAVFCLKKKK